MSRLPGIWKRYPVGAPLDDRGTRVCLYANAVVVQVLDPDRDVWHPVSSIPYKTLEEAARLIESRRLGSLIVHRDVNTVFVDP